MGCKIVQMRENVESSLVVMILAAMRQMMMTESKEQRHPRLVSDMPIAEGEMFAVFCTTFLSSAFYIYDDYGLFLRVFYI